MCLIITAAAAAFSAVLWRFKFRDPKYKFINLVFMYFGAALMWSVDGIFSVAEGEGFFDLSANDALLGLVVVVCGAAFWAVNYLFFTPERKLVKKGN